MSRASRLKELLRDSVTGHFYGVPFRGEFPRSSIGVRRESSRDSKEFILGSIFGSILGLSRGSVGVPLGVASRIHCHLLV